MRGHSTFGEMARDTRGRIAASPGPALARVGIARQKLSVPGPATRHGLTAFMVALFCCTIAMAEPLKAGVGILPQAYLAERIGGPNIEVAVLVGPGQNYHTYEPTPKQLADLAGASLYFQMGLSFEKRLVEKIVSANPNVRVVDLLEGIALRPMDAEPGEEHPGHGAMDPHVWLNPLDAKILARNMAGALQQRDPAHAAAYASNLGALDKDLDALHARVSDLLTPFKGRTFYVYHPSFGYFADVYGLKQAAVEIEGKEPTARQLAALIDRAKKEGVRAIFVQQQFPRKCAEAVAREIGGKVIAVDPLARDYVAGVESIAQSLHDVWTQP
ncbi:MAG: zinc ABC transporter substrate-binding protein, partial [Candidatus Hydrogenedentes bacterium]|nr:zinc ABC transporter substrate-binding protein [Candidatus Hydrogenedentota bacterium]